MGNLGATELAVILVFAAFGIGLFVLYVWSIVWAYRDAEARGREGLLVALLVALVAWPLGLLLWFLLRPSDADA